MHDEDEADDEEREFQVALQRAAVGRRRKSPQAALGPDRQHASSESRGGADEVEVRGEDMDSEGDEEQDDDESDEDHAPPTKRSRMYH